MTPVLDIPPINKVARVTASFFLLSGILLASRAFADPTPDFITRPGTFALQADTTLRLAPTASNKIELALQGVATIPGGKNPFRPENRYVTECPLAGPYVFHWDAPTRCLWWAAPAQIGMIEFRAAETVRSRTCGYAEGLAQASIPKDFAAKVRALVPPEASRPVPIAAKPPAPARDDAMFPDEAPLAPKEGKEEKGKPQSAWGDTSSLNLSNGPEAAASILRDCLEEGFIVPRPAKPDKK